MKKYLSILLILVTVFMVTACSTKDDINSKVFTEPDFEITLNNDFVKQEIQGLKYYYVNEKLGVIAVVNNESKQLFENAGVDFPDDAKGYAEFVVKANGLDSEVTSKGDKAYFSYERLVSGKEYHFYAVTVKSADTCWLIQFRCEKDKVNEFKADFDKWAETIKVK